ncbi:hypothetical protein LX92_03058 [Maribacter polysiphoniae]|uniref:Uncharacterized protein n=1 Tax=Maribacter polysiphoniae TaxID=429344 RepID=A0A316E1E1_9FLAO|nr:hypothetical protein LX92_03058 [Maribacter polysiphoniae]
MGDCRRKLTKNEFSGIIDKFKIELRKNDLPRTKAVEFFIEDIVIKKLTENSRP